MSVCGMEEAPAKEEAVKAIMGLSTAASDTLLARLEDVRRKLERVGSIDLQNSEFLSVLFLFNHKLSSVLAATAFQVLLKIKMTETQLCQLFDWKRGEDVGEDMYWSVNWSFLDKNSETKQQLIPFLIKIAAAYPRVVWDVLRTLFLLLDDEDLLVRVRCYKGVYRVAKTQWRGWRAEEKAGFRSNLRYFKNGISILRKECAAYSQRQKEVTIGATRAGDAVKVHVRLGKKLRGAQTVICISGAETKHLPGQRKHTVVYCKKERVIMCQVEHNGKTVKKKRILTPLGASEKSSKK